MQQYICIKYITVKNKSINKHEENTVVIVG